MTNRYASEENEMLCEYHVWLTQKGRFAVVDTYYQKVLTIHESVDEAYATIHVLRNKQRGKQRGKYPSIIEAS